VADREWREASDMRVSVVNLALVLLCALLLRLWSLGSGLPGTLLDDERAVLSQVIVALQSNLWHPSSLDPSPLLSYLLVPVAVARFLAGVASGTFTSVEELTPEALAFWGRLTVALCGTATVWIVFQIGLRWGARHALLGAGLMTVMPTHVRASHFLTPDVPAVFLLALGFLLSIRAAERPTWQAFALAGGATGLAAAMSPVAALAVALPLTAAWMTLTAVPSRRVCGVAALGAALLLYVASCPFVLLDLPWFLNDVARRTAERAATDPQAAWWVPVGHLTGELGFPAMLLMIGGMALGIVRAVKGPGRTRWTLATGFPIVAVLAGSSMSLVDARVLTLLPAACLLAAIAVVSGVSQLRRFEIPRAPRTALIAGLTVLAVLPPLLSALHVARTLSHTPVVVRTSK
jgi:4-amino-4-deoxy-L-arabinose transferase-like glycosyltransferase